MQRNLNKGLRLLDSRKQAGFTVIDLIIVIVVTVVVTGFGLLVYRVFLARTINGSFETAPPVISAGQTTTFIYKVTQQVGIGAAKPLNGRSIRFRVAPAEGIIAITPENGTTLHTAIAGAGTIIVEVTPHADYRSGGNIRATDIATGEEDVVYFTVVGP